MSADPAVGADAGQERESAGGEGHDVEARVSGGHARRDQPLAIDGTLIEIEAAAVAR